MQKILVWGNLGSNKTLILLQQFIKDPATPESIRIEAILALKFIPSKEVDKLLSKILLETNKNLQTAARQVIEFRNENLSF